MWAALRLRSIVTSSLTVLAGFGLFVNILVLTSPIYMMQVYDRVLPSGRLETLVYLSLMALAALVAFAMLDGVRSFLVTRVGAYVDTKLREPVLLAAVSLARNGREGSRRIVDDLSTIRNYFGSTAILALLDFPWVPFFVIVMWMMHPWFGILGLSSALVLFLLTLITDRTTRRPLDAAAIRQGIASEFASGAMANAEVIAAMGMQQAISARYGDIGRAMAEANRAAGDAGAILSAISRALRVIVQSATLGLGAYLVISGQTSSGSMIASSILLGRALAPIDQSIGSWRQFTTMRIALAHIRTLLKEVPAQERGTSVPLDQGGLEAKGVGYRLPNSDAAILRNISFTVPQGTALALVGPTASGKSTLCRLLVGALAPAVGSVRLSGAEIASIAPADAGAAVGYLPQTIELFSGTVRENISRLTQADDEAVVAAAMEAGCHDMILRLPKAYETELGPRAMFLSGGQRQRLGLARALFGSPRLIVLDEPNANLDQDGEQALVQAIRNAKARGSIVIVVSHRSTLLEPIDLLGILRDGTLERFGPRDRVLQELNTRAAPRPVLRPVRGTDTAGPSAGGGVS